MESVLFTCFQPPRAEPEIRKTTSRSYVKHEPPITMSPAQVLHPLKGESLTVGAVATVAWATAEGLISKTSGGTAEGTNLWVVGARGGDEALIGQEINPGCMV